MRNRTAFRAILFCLMTCVTAQENQKRNRGESFYNLRNSNTAGHGDIWLTFKGVGHVWDNDNASLDSSMKSKRKWVSNIRAFPELRAEAGLFNLATVSLESRLLSYGFRAGYLSCGLKLTTPDNIDLRWNGFGLELTLLRHFHEANPTLGGYSGFMPEGFVVKGYTLETRFLYEMDLLARFSTVPLRFIVNLGSRIPLRKDRLQCFQFLSNTGLIYSGYGFDFFAQYSLEAFNNLFSPIKIREPDGKVIAVYFQENPMYLILGGNIRYDNGCVLNLSIPLLLSKNRESRMRVDDLVELHRNVYPGLFVDEKRMGIKDPFDPWFVKWMIAGSISFPVRHKLTSAEMMRNYLIQKNRKQQIKIDVDQKIRNEGNKREKHKNNRNSGKKRKSDGMLID